MSQGKPKFMCIVLLRDTDWSKCWLFFVYRTSLHGYILVTKLSSELPSTRASCYWFISSMCRWFPEGTRMEVRIWVCWWCVPCSQPHGWADPKISTERSRYREDLGFARHSSADSQFMGWSHQCSSRTSYKQAVESNSVSKMFFSTLILLNLPDVEKESEGWDIFRLMRKSPPGLRVDSVQELLSSWCNLL